MNNRAISGPVVLQATRINKTFRDGQRELAVLKDINLEIAAGQMMAIVGSSGSGKSTLLQILGALDRPTSGQVVITGQPLDSLSDNGLAALRNTTIGYVYQFHHLLPEFTALENVCMPLLMRPQMEVAQIRAEAGRLLQRVGLGSRMTHKPGELSGGERQRVAIARALVSRPKIMLADEPTGNLDGENARSVFELIRELQAELGLATLIVTHDMRLASQADQVCQLEDGHWVKDIPAGV